MGYKAQHWSAQDPSFRAKVEAALLKLGASKLDSTNARTKAMARGLVAGQIQQVLTDLCLALALAGLDIDSLDSEIDTGILANVNILEVRTGADSVVV